MDLIKDKTLKNDKDIESREVSSLSIL